MDVFMPVMPMSSAGRRRSSRRGGVRVSLQLFQALGRRKREHHGRFRYLWLPFPGAPSGTERSSLVEAKPLSPEFSFEFFRQVPAV